MSRLTIRNYHDAWRAFDLLCGEGGRHVRIWFENCVTTVDSSEPIDGIRKAKGFIALQVAIRRQFCWLKHGSRYLGRLSPADRAATEIDVEYHPNGRHIRYDLTRALNALAGAVEQWDEYGPPWLSRTGDLFTANLQRLGAKVETWPQAARDVGVAYIGSLTPKDRRGIGRLAVVMCALVVIVPEIVPEGLSFIAKRWDAVAAHQERMVLAEPTTVVTTDGRHAKLSAAEMAKIDRDLDAENMRVGSIISDNIETPLLSFVVAEAEMARPALLDMAPSWGTITINGLPLQAATAKAGAKAMRKAAKQKRDVGTGWITTTTRAGEA